MGSTCREKSGHLVERISEYLTNGSHKKDLIDDALSKDYSIYLRYRESKTKEQSEDDENCLLDTFDYAWNKRMNGAIRNILN